MNNKPDANKGSSAPRRFWQAVVVCAAVVALIPYSYRVEHSLQTEAAAIMIVVFAVFTLGGFLVIKMLGFTLTVAVLIDVTLVRMVIGPALLPLAGDWNWWPWGLRGAVASQMNGRGR
jgi:uncharacterized membrane protein YdfJ with MMPL/SSD domain